MIKIRRNVFETNSSSTHSLCICSEKEYNDWIDGKLLFNVWTGTFIETDKIVGNPDLDDEDIEEYCTFDEFPKNEYMETFERKYTTENGDKIVAFGYYGYDG